MISNSKTKKPEEIKSARPIRPKAENSLDPYEEIIINELGGEKIA
jgi:hypothetical protein